MFNIIVGLNFLADILGVRTTQRDQLGSVSNLQKLGDVYYGGPNKQDKGYRNYLYDLVKILMETNCVLKGNDEIETHIEYVVDRSFMKEIGKTIKFICF